MDKNIDFSNQMELEHILGDIDLNEEAMYQTALIHEILYEVRTLKEKMKEDSNLTEHQEEGRESDGRCKT